MAEADQREGKQVKEGEKHIPKGINLKTNGDFCRRNNLFIMMPGSKGHV
jgi:hypothetical protein